MKRYHVIEKLITSNNYRSMIEIGVGKGATVKHLCEVIKSPFMWTGIDPYIVYEDYSNDINGTAKRVEDNRRHINSFLQRGGSKWVSIDLLRQESGQAYGLFEDNSIDIVFVDGNHSYEYVANDIIKYWPKVKVWGVMVFHDYYLNQFPGVKKAVDEHFDGKFVKMLDLVVVKKRKL